MDARRPPAARTPAARTPAAVGIDDVVAAAAVLDGTIRPTLLQPSRALSEAVGGPVYLKCENLQRTGSFKVRGAYVRIARLSPEQRARGVVAASAGNHAQGVALAASALGTRATVVMPLGAPLPKVAATRGYGAEVILHGLTIESALARARELSEATGAELIHPFEHRDVIAGQGTVGLEIAGQCPDARTIAVPVGGGGLAAGIAVAAAARLPGATVIGVAAEAVAATMADGIAVAERGALTGSILAGLGCPVVTASEEGLSRGLLLCLERAKQLVEPAGAAGVAAVLEHPELFAPPVVVVLSGGNIDPLLLAKVLRHGLAAAGRYLALRCRLPDRPGALASLLAQLADLGANVLEVVHERVTADLHVNEAEVVLQVETRGPGHSETVTRVLRESGYTLMFG
jgi:threonine dehydratase